MCRCNGICKDVSTCNNSDSRFTLTDNICGLTLEQWTELGIMSGPTILVSLAKQLRMSKEDLSVIFDSMFISLFENR